jgi:hypothetical protein
MSIHLSIYLRVYLFISKYTSIIYYLSTYLTNYSMYLFIRLLTKSLYGCVSNNRTFEEGKSTGVQLWHTNMLKHIGVQFWHTSVFQHPIFV